MTAHALDRGLASSPLSGPIVEKLATLQGILAELESAIVAFSGGVDSTLLARVAHGVLGRRVVACTAVSPSLAAAELDDAVKLAAVIGIRHRLVRTAELEREEYARNTPNRCYVCKGVLFAQLQEIARTEGIGSILYGANVDDGADFRPGARAAEEAGVRAPLAEAGLTKAEVRTLSRAFGLPNADKPAAPCLASRVPYGHRVTVEKLRQLEAAEDVLHRLGFGEVRVRHHEEIARIEVPADELGRAARPEIREVVVRELLALGFRYVALDLRGFRSGSLNEGLSAGGTMFPIAAADRSGVEVGPSGLITLGPRVRPATDPLEMNHG